ncbi:MAG: biotin carboxylase [Pseudomonas sp.]|nr:biotin carboxylase [Pseudomonas sp.]
MSRSRTSTEKSEVVLLSTHKKLATHEVVSHQAIAESIATLLGARFSGMYDSAVHKEGGLYFIPSDTLFGREQQRALGIESVDDFLGGIVDQPFMATKAISHPLLDHATAQPDGWSEQFCQRAGTAVLEGFTVFNQADALRAGNLLLVHGPVRIKPVLATAGRGQIVATSESELSDAIALQDPDDVATWGLTIEEDLQDVVTYSVGQILVGGMIASYYGTQSLTQDNNGETVYGGSELSVVRGDYPELLKLGLEKPIRRAIGQAMAYENAAIACFPDFLASRRNYDIAQGKNARTQHCSGVLEQSWRIGGATAAEVEALMAFAADRSLRRIRCSTHEIYGETTLPADATVLYAGNDPDVGFISKFTRVQPYER